MKSFLHILILSGLVSINVSAQKAVKFKFSSYPLSVTFKDSIKDLISGSVLLNYVEIEGGVLPLSYEWQPSNLFENYLIDSAHLINTSISPIILKVTDKSGCSMSDSLKLLTTSVSNRVTNEFNIYPNPFRDNMHIIINKSVKNIIVVDESGKLVYKSRNIDLEPFSVFDLRNLAPGYYIIKIETIENKIFTQKILKQ